MIEYSIPKLSTKRPTKLQVDYVHDLENLHGFFIPIEYYNNYNYMKNIIDAYGYHIDLPEAERKQTGIRRVNVTRAKFECGATEFTAEEHVIIAVNQWHGLNKWSYDDTEQDPEDEYYGLQVRQEEEASWNCL